jgi:hypothetical protein
MDTMWWQKWKPCGGIAQEQVRGVIEPPPPLKGGPNPHLCSLRSRFFPLSKRGKIPWRTQDQVRVASILQATRPCSYELDIE